jgi:hypothetical protein
MPTPVGTVRGTLNSWNAMRARCDNPNTPGYENYGGRGITYCEAWKKFATFKSDMGYRPVNMTLERLDNDSPYSKSNCIWADMVTQSANRRLNYT